MLSRTLELTLHRALQIAKEHAHEFATLEHLLYALTEDQDALPVLSACDVDIEKLQSQLTAYIKEELSGLVARATGGEPRPTAGFQRVLQRAAIHVQS